MLNLIHAEFYKLRKSTVSKISLLVITICAITLAVLSHYIAIGTIPTDVIGNASGLGEIMMLSLFGTLMVGVLVCSDFQTKIIHAKVICGSGRKNIVISKIIVFAILIVILMLPYILVGVGAFCANIELTSAVPSITTSLMADNTVFPESTILKVIAVSLVQILVFIARISICIPLAFKVKKQSIVMGAGFLLLGLIDFGVSLIDKVNEISGLTSLTPYAREYLLLSVDTGVNTLIKASVTSIIFIVLMGVVSYKIFKKAEIK